MPNEIKIRPFRYRGRIQAPASKSCLQRALVISSLAGGTSTLQRISWASDTLAVKSCIEHLGASVGESADQVVVNPDLTRIKEGTTLHVGESGLALRTLSGIAAYLNRDLAITGYKTLAKRPLHPIINTMHQVGVEVKTNSGGLPLRFDGPLKAGNFRIDGSFSSQILTGLLIALPLCESDSTIVADNLVSLPYIAMTMEIMQSFGVAVRHENFHRFYIAGQQQYRGSKYVVEGDWSGAANHLVGAAISGEVSVKGLNPTSIQADKSILDVLETYGAQVNWSGDTITAIASDRRPFDFDATHCPDLFPPLVVLAISAHGTSRIHGIHRLTHKESNRLLALVKEFSKIGADLSHADDTLTINGTGTIAGGAIYSHNDHRIAMATAIAATLSEDDIIIDKAKAVEKSYPDFFRDLQKMT